MSVIDIGKFTRDIRDKEVGILEYYSLQTGTFLSSGTTIKVRKKKEDTDMETGTTILLRDNERLILRQVIKCDEDFICVINKKGALEKYDEKQLIGIVVNGINGDLGKVHQFRPNWFGRTILNSNLTFANTVFALMLMLVACVLMVYVSAENAFEPITRIEDQDAKKVFVISLVVVNITFSYTGLLFIWNFIQAFFRYSRSKLTWWTFILLLLAPLVWLISLYVTGKAL